ncbi:MAG: AbrB/MazE/SpoVT family DNA-binding domain-containing protein [Blautia sp.]|nr:AbrB/MazE/SpoVT family DNA-binding domain-containing protein [Blautia sp.]
MRTTKVFTNGRSQAVRIPKEYRFDADEVFINKIGDAIVLTPIESLAHEFDLGARMLPDDFLIDGLPGEIGSMREEL